jgi:hypothetical protein
MPACYYEADDGDYQDIMNYDGSNHNRNHNLETLLYIMEKNNVKGTDNGQIYRGTSLRNWSESKGKNENGNKIGGVLTTQGAKLYDIIKEIRSSNKTQYREARARFINDMFFSKNITHPTLKDSNLTVKPSEEGAVKKKSPTIYKKYGNPTIISIAHAFGINYTAITAASLGLLDNLDYAVNGYNALESSIQYYERLLRNEDDLQYRIADYVEYLPIAISASLCSIIENGYTSLGSFKTKSVRMDNFSRLSAPKVLSKSTGKMVAPPSKRMVLVNGVEKSVRIPSPAEIELGNKIYYDHMKHKLVTRLFNPITNTNNTSVDASFISTLGFLEERLISMTNLGKRTGEKLTIVSSDEQVIQRGSNNTKSKNNKKTRKVSRSKSRSRSRSKSRSPVKKGKGKGKGKQMKKMVDVSMEEE